MGRERGYVAVVLAMVGCRASAAPAIDTEDTSSSTSSTSTGTEETTSSTGAAESSSSTGSVADGPPVVVDLGKSVTFVGEGELATLTAFVQHPRGDAAVVEGVLLGPGEPAEYGAFERGINGRWSIEVGWDDVAAHTDLSFEGELVVDFVARFVDDAGLTGEGAIGLPHQCIPLAPNACDGDCADFSSSKTHCGGCDQPCAEQQPRIGLPVGGCDAGSCAPLWSACFDALEHADCAAACSAFGSSCVEAGCGGQTIMPIEDAPTCRGESLPGGFVDPDSCAAVLVGPFARCCCAS